MTCPQLYRVVVDGQGSSDTTIWLYAISRDHATSTVQELCPNSRLISVNLAPQWDDLTA